MKAYKGFNPDMKCRGFQYKEGGKYETDRAEVCKSGFHACENPIDCLNYYEARRSVYHEVELDGDIDHSGDDTKVAATKIKIGARLDIPALCHAAFEYVRTKCTNENNAEAGKPATAGYRGAASAGAFGAASAGEFGAASAGESGAASAGYRGAASAGESGAASAGEFGAASAGASGAAVSRGSASVEENGIACVRGNGVKVKGGIGSILVIAEEYSGSFKVETWKAFEVDGKKYKADTWYALRDGKVVEVEN